MHKIFDIFYDETNKVYQIRTKSNVFVIEFPDPIEEKVFLSIISAYEKQDFYTYSLLRKVLKAFPEDKVLDVVQELSASGILNPDNFESETPRKEVPTFYGNGNWAGLTNDPTTFHLCFIGHEALGEQLKAKATYHQFSQLDCLSITPNSVVEENEIKDIIESHDFIIMDSTFWNPRLMSLFNKLMLQCGKPWLNVSGMIDPYNYSIGPIFHGEETGCYDCVEKRNISNDINATYTESYRNYLEKNNKFSQNIKAPKPVEEIIANIILMDITRYILGNGVPEMWKHCLLYDSSCYSVSKHYILKNPLCHTCNPALNFSTSPWVDGIIDD